MYVAWWDLKQSVPLRRAHTTRHLESCITTRAPTSVCAPTHPSGSYEQWVRIRPPESGQAVSTAPFPRTSAGARRGVRLSVCASRSPQGAESRAAADRRTRLLHYGGHRLVEEDIGVGGELFQVLDASLPLRQHRLLRARRLLRGCLHAIRPTISTYTVLDSGAVSRSLFINVRNPSNLTVSTEPPRELIRTTGT